MPRQARKHSKSGIYHVMLRGINKQQIFEEKEDYLRFLQIIEDCKAVSGYKLFAYCLMGNHIHLLMQPVDEPIEQVFKRINGRFVYWYNVKYQRSGHLFQDRFKSEPVEDDRYFLTVLRYIHQNPIKAGICKKVGEYEYSSYKEYIDEPKLIDTAYVFSTVTKEDYIRLNNELCGEQCLDISEASANRMTDEDAKKLIKKHSKCSSLTEFQNLDKEAKDKLIKLFHQKGLSIRQISRLTGISIGIVRRMIGE